MNMSGRTQGWIVLAAGAVGVFMTTPGQTVGVSAFVDHIAADLGLPREQVVMLYSVGTLLGILPAPLIGRLVDPLWPAPRNCIYRSGTLLRLRGCGLGSWTLEPCALALGSAAVPRPLVHAETVKP